MLPNQLLEELEKLKDAKPDCEVHVRKRVGDSNGGTLFDISNIVVGPYGLEILVDYTSRS